jgi:diguanylate cyclase (GGDEF)-like protein
VHWLVLYIAIMAMMMVLDLINTRLKRERDSERERFEHLASHDPLTQLANRHRFDDNLRLAVARAQRHKHSVALFFIDLDGFKPINDNYGHDMGDRVLQVVAARLQTHFRNIDTVARLGGDEFAIIIEDLHDEQRAVQLAQKIVDLLGDPIESLPLEITLGGSVGVAMYPQHAHDEAHLVRYADTAMYQAKRHRENYRLFDSAMLEPLKS